MILLCLVIFVRKCGALPVFNFITKYSHLHFLYELLIFTCFLHVWVPVCGYVYQTWTWCLFGPKTCCGFYNCSSRCWWVNIWMVGMEPQSSERTVTVTVLSFYSSPLAFLMITFVNGSSLRFWLSEISTLLRFTLFSLFFMNKMQHIHIQRGENLFYMMSWFTLLRFIFSIWQ